MYSVNVAEDELKICANGIIISAETCSMILLFISS